MFSAGEIGHYLDHLVERKAAFADELAPAEDEGDILMETAEQRTAARARLAQIKDLLTSRMLGTG